MSLPTIDIFNHLVGAVVGSFVTGLIAFGYSLWIKRFPIKIDSKSHQAAGGKWTSNFNLLMKNRGKKTCHAIWLAITTDNPNYDFMNFKIEEAEGYPPYGQMFLLKDILVGADFTHILRCEANATTYKTMQVAMLLPGDQRLFKITASEAIKKQKFFFKIVHWSKTPVQILTEKGKTAISFSIPSSLCGTGKEIKMLAQGIIAKRQS